MVYRFFYTLFLGGGRIAVGRHSEGAIATEESPYETETFYETTSFMEHIAVLGRFLATLGMTTT